MDNVEIQYDELSKNRGGSKMAIIRHFFALLVVYLFMFCVFVPGSNAATIYASSASYADVKSAYNAASEGDIVVVPPGTATWTSMLNIRKGITLLGAGIDSTTIINGIASSTIGDYIIGYSQIIPAADPTVIIAGFTFDANNHGGCIRVHCQDDTYPCYNFKIQHNKLKNAADNSKTSTGMAIRTKGNTFGLIYRNQFVDNYRDLKVYGNDDNSWTNYPGIANVGTANYLYVENNTSTGSIKTCLSSGEGARWVYRYNTIDNTNHSSNSLIWEAHGDTRNRGVVAHEIYENTATSSGDAATQSYSTHNYKGGTGIIYNNSVQFGTSGIRSTIKIQEQYEGCNDPVAGGYLWNNVNSRDGNIIAAGDYLIGSDYDPYDCIAEDTDWWDDADSSKGGEDPSNFTSGTNRPATCTDDDCYWETDTKKLYRCDGANNWIFVYEPYTHPHPLIKPSPLRNYKITN